MSFHLQPRINITDFVRIFVLTFTPSYAWHTQKLIVINQEKC